MHRDRFVLALVAVAIVVVGVVALNWPTSLNEWDTWGFRITCGTAVTPDYLQATIADQAGESSDYVGECNSAIWWRRGWSGALVLIGAGMSAALVLRRLRDVPAEAESS